MNIIPYSLPRKTCLHSPEEVKKDRVLYLLLLLLFRDILSFLNGTESMYLSIYLSISINRVCIHSGSGRENKILDKLLQSKTQSMEMAMDEVRNSRMLTYVHLQILILFLFLPLPTLFLFPKYPETAVESLITVIGRALPSALKPSLRISTSGYIAAGRGPISLVGKVCLPISPIYPYH